MIYAEMWYICYEIYVNTICRNVIYVRYINICKCYDQYRDLIYIKYIRKCYDICRNVKYVWCIIYVNTMIHSKNKLMYKI